MKSKTTIGLALLMILSASTFAGEHNGISIADIKKQNVEINDRATGESGRMLDSSKAVRATQQGILAPKAADDNMMKIEHRNEKPFCVIGAKHNISGDIHSILEMKFAEGTATDSISEPLVAESFSPEVEGIAALMFPHFAQNARSQDIFIKRAYNAIMKVTSDAMQAARIKFGSFNAGIKAHTDFVSAKVRNWLDSLQLGMGGKFENSCRV